MKLYALEKSNKFNMDITIYNPGILTSKDLKAIAALYNRKLTTPGLYRDLCHINIKEEAKWVAKNL